jgi:hypothetical protein
MAKSLNRLDVIWVLLSAITILSWRIAIEPVGRGMHLDAAITAAVVAFALVKARFIIREFMAVRTAPRSIKWLSDLWLIGLFAILMTLYFRA